MNNRQGKITPRRGGRGQPPFSAGRKSPSPPAPEKALPLLGIARRAGRLALGMDPAVEAMQKQKAFLLLLSPDLFLPLPKESSGAGGKIWGGAYGNSLWHG